LGILEPVARNTFTGRDQTTPNQPNDIKKVINVDFAEKKVTFQF